MKFDPLMFKRVFATLLVLGTVARSRPIAGNVALRRVGCLIFCVAFGAAVLARGALAQGTQNLTGESFSAADIFRFPNGQISITANCNPDGNSTFSYTASGSAFGPYPGTFTEAGTVTIGPQFIAPGQGIAFGDVQTFSASFTIDSPLGQVTGTKSLPVPGFHGGTCVTPAPGSPFSGATLFLPTATYAAQIHTSGAGTFADSGDTTIEIGQSCAIRCANSFLEFFTSTAPISTPGQATGGGQIMNTATTSGVIFGFEVFSDAHGIRGHCNVVGDATHVRCLDVTQYAQTGNGASFSGNAEINGQQTTYRVDVQDNGEPGIGSDTFTITTASGYGATGVLTQGNIQVH